MAKKILVGIAYIFLSLCLFAGALGSAIYNLSPDSERTSWASDADGASNDSGGWWSSDSGSSWGSGSDSSWDSGSDSGSWDSWDSGSDSGSWDSDW